MHAQHVFSSTCTIEQVRLLVTNKTEHFDFKSGCAMRVVKLIKEEWPIAFQYEFRLNITKILEYKAKN